MTLLYVVRHGQTDLNKEGRLQGRNGKSLNEDGIRQAETLRRALSNTKFDYVFSSPQKRAIQTAEISTGIKPVIEERLDVFDLGEADGMRKLDVKLDGILSDRNVYSGMEDIRDFLKRIFSFVAELQRKHKDQEVNILLSGHRCTTGGIGAYFEGVPEDKNILRYSSDNGKFRIYTFTERG
jgi:uncharacterized phosphatase